MLPVYLITLRIFSKLKKAKHTARLLSNITSLTGATQPSLGSLTGRTTSPIGLHSNNLLKPITPDPIEKNGSSSLIFDRKRKRVETEIKQEIKETASNQPPLFDIQRNCVYINYI